MQMETEDRSTVCVCFRGQRIASQNWCSREPLPKSSSLLRGGYRMAMADFFVFCSVLLPEFQAVPLGVCMTPWILLGRPYLLLRSPENAGGRGGQAGQITGCVSAPASRCWVGAGSCEAAQHSPQSTAFWKMGFFVQMPKAWGTAASQLLPHPLQITGTKWNPVDLWIYGPRDHICMAGQGREVREPSVQPTGRTSNPCSSPPAVRGA